MDQLNDDKRIENIDEIRIKVDPTKYQLKKKKGGINSRITEIRSMTVKMLNEPRYEIVTEDNERKAKRKSYPPVTFEQIAGLTTGWSYNELYSIYREAIGFRKNPQALWWIKCKEFNNKNAEKIKKRINERRLCKMGKKGGTDQQEERTQVLF